MAYSTLSDSQIDGDSPLISDTFFKLRDNPIAIANGDAGAPRIQAAALDTGVALANIAAGTIVQGKLSTSTGEVSTTTDNANTVLPGGEYGFYPRLRIDSPITYAHASMCSDVYFDGTTTVSNSSPMSTTYATRISFGGIGAGTVYAQQRYINSSPPYNLGDGDVPLFVFAIVDGNGDVVATYTADVPPWAYNGPTRVTADRIDHVTGKKYQRRCYLCRERGEVVRDEIEVTNEIKNADMALIPHPFIGNDLTGKTVVLLDPVETLDLLDLHEMGECVSDLLYSRHLVVDNQRISRAAPAGVQPCAIRWKQAQQKWRAVPSVMAKSGKSARSQ